jgi:hypothetical protein
VLASGAAALVLALALAWSPPARADRYEVTLWLRPTSGVARVADSGTEERDTVESRGLAAGASFGVRDWLDLGGELVAADFEEAQYALATLPVSVNLFSGPLKRSSRIAQARGVATFRFGVKWVPTIQLALGAGARHRFTALLFVRTAQGPRWVIPDDQRQEVTVDIVTAVRAGFERRLTPHWTAGISAAVSQSIGIFAPDVQTADVSVSLSYTWYPLLAP